MREVIVFFRLWEKGCSTRIGPDVPWLISTFEILLQEPFSLTLSETTITSPLSATVNEHLSRALESNEREDEHTDCPAHEVVFSLALSMKELLLRVRSVRRLLLMLFGALERDLCLRDSPAESKQVLSTTLSTDVAEGVESEVSLIGVDSVQ